MELLMCNLYKLWSCVVCVLFLLAKQVGSYHISVQSKCEDVYIWYGDGSVDCDYLITPSNYGLHKKQRYFCTQYALTRCCETCAFLRRHDYAVTNGVRRPTGITSLPSTPQQPGQLAQTQPADHQFQTQQPGHQAQTQQSGHPGETQPAGQQGQTQPPRHQAQTDITHLPSTSKQSGVRIQSVFTHVPSTPRRPDRILFTVPTSRQEITTHRLTRARPTTTAQPVCEDSYIWLFDGRVDCQFLVTPTVYGLHTNQRFYCVEYPFTRCCHTCDILRTYNYDYINGAYSQITSGPNTTTTQTSTTQSTTARQTVNTTLQQTVGLLDMIIPNNILSPDVIGSIPPSAAKIVLQLTGSPVESTTQPTTKLPAALHRTIKMFFNALVTMHTNKPSHHMLHGAAQTSQTPSQTTTVKTTTRTTTTTPVPTTTTPVPTTTTTTPVPTTTTTTPVPTTTTLVPTTTPVPTTTTTTPVPTTTTTTPVPTTTTTPVPTTTTTPVPTTTTTTPVPTTTTTTPVPTTTTTTPVPTTTTPVPTTTRITPVPTTTRATQPSTKRVTVPEPKVVARPDCVDVGIWIISGSVGCDYLEKDNKYGLNKNQMYFCLRYPLTSCCETCGRIIRAHRNNMPIKP